MTGTARRYGTERSGAEAEIIFLDTDDTTATFYGHRDPLHSKSSYINYLTPTGAKRNPGTRVHNLCVRAYSYELITYARVLVVLVLIYI